MAKRKKKTKKKTKAYKHPIPKRIELLDFLRDSGKPLDLTNGSGKPLDKLILAARRSTNQ